MLLVTQVNPDTGLDLHLLSMESGYGLKPLLQGRFLWRALHSSRAMAGGSLTAPTRPGIHEIYVRPFPKRG